jgi:4-hydroxy-tetrahydrodipicolinate synthase
MDLFHRLFAAVITPFDNNYKVDEAGLRTHLRYFLQPKFVNAGGAILINPEAGELFYLSRKEKLRNIEIAVEECGGKVPVVAGVIEPTTAESISGARDVKAAGVDGIFLMPPMGSMDVTTAWDSERYPEVWLDMAKEICDAVDLPAITHPVTTPSAKYGSGLPLGPTIKMCQEIPQIVGWKMTYNYGGFRLIARALRRLPRHVAILCATAAYFHEYLAWGRFDGSVSGSWNYAMEPMVDHIEAWRRGDLNAARQIWDSGLAELHEYVYSEYSRLHVRYKTACWLRGLIDNPLMRPPQPKPQPEEVRRLRELLSGAGLKIISEAASKKILGVTVSA